MTTSDSNLITARDVAKMLNIHPARVTKWAGEGKIPIIRINKRVLRFRREDILAFIASHEQSS